MNDPHKLYVIDFHSQGNVIPEKRVAVQATSPDRALDAFWGWIRLQPWYLHTWQLNISMAEVLLIAPLGPNLKLY